MDKRRGSRWVPAASIPVLRGKRNLGDAAGEGAQPAVSGLGVLSLTAELTCDR